MIMESPRDATLSVRIPSELKEWLDETAEARGVSVSTFLIELLQRSKRVSQPSLDLLRRDLVRAERMLERVKTQMERLEVDKDAKLHKRPPIKRSAARREKPRIGDQSSPFDED